MAADVGPVVAGAAGHYVCAPWREVVFPQCAAVALQPPDRGAGLWPPNMGDSPTPFGNQVFGGDVADLLVVDAVELASSLCLGALRAGARVYNLVTVEDVAVRDGKVVGVVINWSAAGLAGLHVDPMVILSRRTIDATGHECDVCRIVEQKAGELDTPTGKIMGEGSMWAEKGEESLVPNSREVFPNLFVAGMAANAVFGSPRMGPVFGGMLLSGKACAERVSKSLRG